MLTRRLEDVAGVVGQVGALADEFAICFEVDHVNRVKPAATHWRQARDERTVAVAIYALPRCIAALGSRCR